METERFKSRVSGVKARGSIDGLKRVDNSKYQITRRNFVDIYNNSPKPLPIEKLQTQTTEPVSQDKPSDQAVNKIADQRDTTNTDRQELIEETSQKRSLIDLESLPGGASSYKARLIIKRPLKPLISKWAFRMSSVAIVATLVIGGLLFTQSYMTLHKVLKGGAKPVAALEANVNPDLLKGEGDGRINILLLGRGGGNHDGPDLTDTMMLASIDPVNKTMALVSIPRDLWVDVPNQGAMKINAAWESGEFAYEGKIAPGSTNTNAINAGYNEADQVVESVLGVTVDYNMIANFQAFQQAVNTLGGITLDVPTTLVDPTMAWENNDSPVLAQAGWQTFTGSQALNYVRSRETTSDFARAQRQRAMMVAIKQKAETLGVVSDPLKISDLFSAFGNNVATDLNLSDADRLYQIIKGISNSSVTSIGLADSPNNYVTTETLNGQSIDIPTAGMFNYSAIQSFIRGQLEDPYIINENAKVLILNGTTDPGLAESTEATLKSYGYNVIGTANAPTTNYDQTTVVDLSGGKDKYTSHYLGERFNTTVLTSLPDKSIQTKGAAFVIILGNDETVNSQG